MIKLGPVNVVIESDDGRKNRHGAAALAPGYQHAFRGNYDTSLPGESFVLKGKDEGIVGLTATYSFN